MKRTLGLFFFLALSVYSFPQADSGINLLVRGDDIGSSHTANLACIESYRNGIVRSVELMVPGPWFPEAVRLLNENPGLDVGVHLVMTSEWNDIKWRPLTCCPSLVDKDGYFYPMVWQRPDFPKNTALKDASWKLSEFEQELRAQIEMARKYVPRISHLDCHMGFESCGPEIVALVKKLAVEYDLDINPGELGYQHTSLWNDKDTTAAQRIASTLQTLENLKPGKYMFVEHPGMNTMEMQAIWHKGYENVASDRDAVTKVFTSKEVMQGINKRGIKLVSYKEIKNSQSGPIRVMVITGGHDYDQSSFPAMFESMQGTLSFKIIPFPEAFSMFAPEKRDEYDVVVFYHMWQSITDEQKKDMMECFRQGKPLVVLHHSICAFDKWDEYRHLIGGKYFHDTSVVEGNVFPPSTYRHEVQIPIKVKDNTNPVTRGIADFELFDEVYGGFYVEPGMTTLLTTSQPESSPVIGWSHTYGNSRVVTLQSGHDTPTFENPVYRKLLLQAIEWAYQGR
jgi:chitin disaccharide deacetylase